MDYDYSENQKEIDELIFYFYAEKFNLTNDLKNKLDTEYSIY